MNFGEVLSKAGTVIWRNKILWLFGILAGCGGNRSSGGSFNYQFSSEDFRTGDLPEPLRRMGEWIVQFFNNTPGYVYIVAAVVVLALIILAIYLSTMGRIGLVLGALRGDEGQEEQSLGTLWNDSHPFFWRMLVLSLLVGVAGLIIFLVLLIPILGLTVLTAGIGLLCLIPFLCVLGIGMWVLGIWIEQSAVAVVAENLPVVDGLRRGWQIFRDNLGQLLVIAVILAIAGFVVNLVLFVPLMITMIPLIMAFMGGTADIGVMGQASIALLLLYLPVMIFIGGVVQSYIGSVWTLAFRRLARPAAPGGAAVY